MPLKPITVVVTASGAPGTAALLRGLRENGERDGAARRHRHVRALGRAPPLRRVPPRARRAPTPASPTPSARSSSARASTASCRSRRSTSKGSPSIATRFPVPVLVSKPDAIFRSNDKAETYAFLHRLGLPAPAFRRVNGAGEVEAAARELGYPDVPVCFKPVFSSGSRGFRILDPDGRPRAPAAERAARIGRDAPRGGGRAPARRGRPRPARDGARDRRRAHDRRDRRRRAHPARAPEDARGDARRARDVLRHARGRGADGASPTGSWPSSRSSTSSTSSSSAST